MTSLLIIAHEEHDKLALHLPTLLSQQGTEFEVVVVDMNSEDDTTDLLKSLKEKHKHLHYFSMPASARDISRERLALHLGMRSASATNVILLDVSTQVPDENWLAAIENRWRPDCDIMLIPTIRARKKGLADFFYAGHEAWRNTMHYRQALQGRMFRAGTMAIGVSRNLFLKHTPTARQLALKTGTMDIFVSHNANRRNTIVLTEPTLFPTIDTNGNSRFWAQKRLFDVETRRHLGKRVRRHFAYILHCIGTIHRGSLVYSIMDLWDELRWCFTRKKTFVKNHY